MSVLIGCINECSGKVTDRARDNTKKNETKFSIACLELMFPIAPQNSQ